MSLATTISKLFVLGVLIVFLRPTSASGQPPVCCALTAMGVGDSLDPRVYYLADDLHVHELAWYSAAWHRRDVTADSGGVPCKSHVTLTATGVGGKRDPRVYCLAADNHVHELAWYSAAWHRRDVTADSGGVPAIDFSALTAIGVGRDLDPRVYYLGEGGHVHELAWYGKGWGHLDVTAAIGAVPAVDPNRSLWPARWALTAMGVGGDLDPRVYYVADDLHVHELALRGDAWYHRDVTADSGGAPTVTEWALTAMGVGGDLDPRVYYVATDNNVHELAWLGNAWRHRNVTAQGGGVRAHSIAWIGFTAMGIGDNLDPRVYHLAADNRVHELALRGDAWYHRDVTADSDGVPCHAATTLTAMGIGGTRDPRVYCLAADNHVHELAWYSAAWHHRDVTADSSQ